MHASSSNNSLGSESSGLSIGSRHDPLVTIIGVSIVVHKELEIAVKLSIRTLHHVCSVRAKRL